MSPLFYAYMPLVLTHIVAGVIAIFAGAVALTVRKGERAHRVSGTVFFLAMLVMAAMATYLAAIIPGQGRNLGGGMLAFYLTATAWMTVKRPAGRVGVFEYAALATILGAAGIFAFMGVQASRAPDGQYDGFPAMGFYFSTGLALFCAAMDLKVIVHGGITGAARIARHLWRMCTALFFATGSFFLGQQQMLPHVMRGSPWLFVPALAPLALMIFWLIRVRLTNWYRPEAAVVSS